MEVKQIATIMNEAYNEMVGSSDLVLEDLSNIADAGKTIFNANQGETFLGALVNRIGRMIFVDRPYAGSAPKILMDSWTFGSVLAKYSTDMPEAEDAPILDLVDGTVYSPNKYTEAKARAKFYNTRLLLQVTCPSISEVMFAQAFISPEEMNRFVSMLYTTCENKMTCLLDDLIFRVICSQAVATILSEYATMSDLPNESHVRAVNLLKLYNDQFNETKTRDDCMYDPNYLKFAGETMRMYIKYMKKMSTLYNNEGRDRFTPENLLHVVIHANFISKTVTYLQSSTFHDELIKLPKYEEVVAWQGTGLSGEKRMQLKAKLGSDGEEVKDLDIVGVMFDERAVAVGNLERWTPTHYNELAHFWNTWYQMQTGPYRDDGENFIVFFNA